MALDIARIVVRLKNYNAETISETYAEQAANSASEAADSEDAARLSELSAAGSASAASSSASDAAQYLDDIEVLITDAASDRLTYDGDIKAQTDTDGLDVTGDLDVSEDVNVSGTVVSTGAISTGGYVVARVIDVTYETLYNAGDVGTGASTLAAGDHNHSGVYEPVDATILREADLTGSGSATTPAKSDHDHSGVYVPVEDFVDPILYKGALDCSTNPNYPAADAGHMYKVSVAGKIGGASGEDVEIGDAVICFVDSSASGDQATVGANWNVFQSNIDPDSYIPKSLGTASGDIIYFTASGTPSRLGIGTEGQGLVITSGVPAWGQVATTGGGVGSTIFLYQNYGR